MLTRTLGEEKISLTPTTETIQTEITKQVDERGFYLYEWITPDELRKSVQSDYLSIIQAASIPLAVVTFIAGIIGLTGWVLWVLIGIIGVLVVFYLIVGIILIVKSLRKSYLYTRWADVVITDNHYISGGKILKKDDFQGQQEAFKVMETVFREPLFKSSELESYITLQKKGLIEKFKTIATGSGKIMDNIGNDKNSGGIILVIIAAGILYSLMMGIVYFAWVWFVALFARVAAWWAHKILLITNNEEHVIQSFFHEISESSIALKQEKQQAIQFLSEAKENEWIENLSGRINTSFEKINKDAAISTKNSVALREKLENSKYREIFNFGKYDTWIKQQVLSPIEELIELLKNNKKIILKTREDTDMENRKKPGDNFWGSSGKQVLEVQQTRFQMQLDSIDRMISMLEGYREKLQ